MRNFEHLTAVACMSWWAYNCARFGVDQRLLFAVPNGGRRHIGVARKLKAEGIRAGVPDYFLAVPRNGMNGLFIELKSEDGRASKEQIEFGELVSAEGYAFYVGHGTDRFIEIIESYLVRQIIF